MSWFPAQSPSSFSLTFESTRQDISVLTFGRDLLQREACGRRHHGQRVPRFWMADIGGELFIPVHTHFHAWLTVGPQYIAVYIEWCLDVSVSTHYLPIRARFQN